MTVETALFPFFSWARTHSEWLNRKNQSVDTGNYSFWVRIVLFVIDSLFLYCLLEHDIHGAASVGWGREKASAGRERRFM
jgi:hypothetical protein